MNQFLKFIHNGIASFQDGLTHEHHSFRDSSATETKQLTSEFCYQGTANYLSPSIRNSHSRGGAVAAMTGAFRLFYSSSIHNLVTPTSLHYHCFITPDNFKKRCIYFSHGSLFDGTTFHFTVKKCIINFTVTLEVPI